MAVCHAQALSIPATQAESEELVAETASMLTLEGEYAAGLDFGGINTSVVSHGLWGLLAARRSHPGAVPHDGPSALCKLRVLRGQRHSRNLLLRTSVLLHRQAQIAIRRAARGGLLSGPQLVAVSSVLRGGGRLRAAVSAVVGQAAREGRPPEVLGPLSAAVKVGLSHRWYEPVSPAPRSAAQAHGRGRQRCWASVKVSAT